MKKIVGLFVLTFSLMMVKYSVAQAQDFILNENFNDNSYGWGVKSDADVTARITDGKYKIDVTKGIFILDQLVSTDLNNSKDWTIEASIYKKSGDCAFGLTWGADGVGSRYNFVIDTKGTYSVHKWTDYNVSFFHTALPCSYINGNYSSNKLAIKKTGSTIKFYINDNYVNEIPDEGQFGKKIGFYANSGELSIEIDYIKAWYTSGSERNENYSTNNTSSRQYILQEYFTENSDRWVKNSDNEHKEEWQYGKYIFEHFRTESSYNTWTPLIGFDDTKDYVLETTISHTGGADNFGFGFIWGFLDVQNKFEFCLSANGYYRIDKNENDVYSNIIKWTSSSYIKQGNYVDNKLTLKKTGSYIKFYINDNYIDQIYATGWYGKKIGFVIYKNQKIEIKNVLVYNEGGVSNNYVPVNNQYSGGNYPDQSNERSFVSSFLKGMDVNVNSTNEEKMRFMSPLYLKSNNIDPNEYKVNNYSIYGYQIENYDNEYNVATVLVWGENKKWEHRVKFKVVKENGKFYMMPTPNKYPDLKYIDPWISVETDVVKN